LPISASKILAIRQYACEFFLALGKIMLENTYTISMWTGSYFMMTYDVLNKN